MKQSAGKPQLPKGFTLIELMIAMTVGLFILGAVSAVAINSGRNARANDRTSELQTNGRYALDVIRRDVQHAGQSGLMPSTTLQQAASSVFTIASGVAVLPAGTGTVADCAPQFALQLQQPVFGIDDQSGTPNPYSATCIPTANYARGDILAVRYADMANEWPVSVASAASAPAAALTNDIYFRSSFSVSSLFQKGGTTPYQVGTVPIQDQLLRTFVYYISPYTTTVGDGIPALWRVNLVAGAMTPELVASGIDNMQVRYGVVDSSGNTQYLDASAISATSWPLVQSVRIWLLARNSSSERNEAYVNNTEYSPTTNPMGNLTSLVPNDKYRRQLYMTTISLRN